MPEVQTIELPSDGSITRAAFEALPAPSGRWAWQLHAGRLELTHVLVAGWHWQSLVAVLEYWRRMGHAVAGDQYVADSGFMRGGTGAILVADGVVFAAGHRPGNGATTHDAADVHVVVAVGSAGSGGRDTVEKRAAYARMGVPHYWIIREASPDEDDEDGLISMYELTDGEYKLVGTRLASQLKNDADEAGE